MQARAHHTVLRHVEVSCFYEDALEDMRFLFVTLVEKTNWEEERTQSNIKSMTPEFYVKNPIWKKNPRVACKSTILSERLHEKKREPHSRSVLTMAHTILITTHLLL